MTSEPCHQEPWVKKDQKDTSGSMGGEYLLLSLTFFSLGLSLPLPLILLLNKIS